MPKILLSLDGVVTRQMQLTKDRTALGRRPYNDIVLDHLAVSGEHAVLVLHGDDVSIEDLDSTNGTFVNGKAVKKQAIKPGDLIEIGRYQLSLEEGSGHAGPDGSQPDADEIDESIPVNAYVKVLTGAATGRVLQLNKRVTTLGMPDVSIASITRRGASFILAHVEGPDAPTVNGTPLGNHPLTLHTGDIIGVAGNSLQFEQGK